MEKIEEKIVSKLIEKKKTISFMESCTGGNLANKITNISGASNVLKVSLVTYSNEFKIRFGVPNNVINEYTVYSKETAMEMSKNVSKFANSDYGIGITGELANKKKEENKVYYCIFDKEINEFTNRIVFVEPDNREKMKTKIAENVLEDLWNILTKN